MKISMGEESSVVSKYLAWHTHICTHIPLHNALGFITNDDQLVVNTRLLMLEEVAQLSADARVDTSAQTTVRRHDHNHVTGLRLVLFQFCALKKSWRQRTNSSSSQLKKICCLYSRQSSDLVAEVTLAVILPFCHSSILFGHVKWESKNHTQTGSIFKVRRRFTTASPHYSSIP